MTETLWPTVIEKEIKDIETEIRLCFDMNTPIDTVKLKRLSQIKVWSSDNFISKTFHMSFTVEYSSPNCLIIKTSFPIEEISKVNMTLNIVIRSISHSISEISVNRQYEIIKLFECNTTKPLLIYPLE